MKRALISDIHSNIESLEAVLADIRDQGISEIFCLGDLVGYGPNPREVIDEVMKCQVCLLGNHDQGAACSIPRVSTPGRKGPFSGPATNWKTPAALRPSANAAGIFWASCPEPIRNKGAKSFTYTGPRNPLNEYVFPEDIYNKRKLEKIFALVPQYVFQGHTHVPGVFTENFNFFSPEEINNEYRLTKEKIMINVGSVGQPRDGNPRSCYVVLEDEVVRFRRVEYPFDKTIAKIYDVPELDNFLGDRLRDGR